MLSIGMYAPDFTAKDHTNNSHSLSEYRGKWLLLYFYPRDNTPGCTTEACTFRDSYTEFTDAGITIVGVSTDSVASHETFVEKFELPFTLLADTEHQIVKAYGAGGLFSRISYLIDPQGKIAQVYDSVKPSEHAAEVLRDMAALPK